MMYVISFVYVNISVCLRGRHQQSDLTDLTFDSRMSPSRLMQDSRFKAERVEGGERWARQARL